MQGAERRVQSVGCGVQVAVPRVRGEGCRVQSAGCRVQDAERGVQGVGCRVQSALHPTHIFSRAWLDSALQHPGFLEFMRI